MSGVNGASWLAITWSTISAIGHGLASSASASTAVPAAAPASARHWRST